MNEMGNSSGGLGSQLSEIRELYRLTDRLYRAKTIDDVFAAALDAIAAALGCERASILLFDEAAVMRFVAWRRLSDAYRHGLEGHTPWRPGEREPLPIFVEDIDETDESDRVKALIRAENIRALAFIPLLAQGGVVGKFMTYFPARHGYDQHERDLALTIARQVGFSIELLRAESGRSVAESRLQQSEAYARAISEDAPTMLWLSDADNKCLHLNAMLRAFWNVAEEDVPSFDWGTTLHPDDADRVGRTMMDAVANRRPVSVRGRYRNWAGEYRVLKTDAKPRFARDGTFLGMIGVNLDVTEAERAEHALRASEERFRLAVEASPSGMLMTGAGGRIELVNAQAERLFGYPRGELVGQRVDMLVPERFRSKHPRLRDAYAKEPSARPMGAGRDLFALRKDGSEVPVEIGLSPIDTPEGPMALAAVVDISERKRSEAQLQLLVAELNHRVKNTLAVVQAIAHQTFRSGDAPLKARAAFEGRLLALAAAHNLLTHTNWEHASFRRLATDALQAAGGYSARITLEGPELLFPPKEALVLAMALHELCTNAVKYGALSNDTGRISLSWSSDGGGEPRLTIEWRESGGPPVERPTRRGFGSRLVERALAQDLNGDVVMDFRPEGLVCRIDAPLPPAHRGLA